MEPVGLDTVTVSYGSRIVTSSAFENAYLTAVLSCTASIRVTDIYKIRSCGCSTRNTLVELGFVHAEGREVTFTRSRTSRRSVVGAGAAVG